MIIKIQNEYGSVNLDKRVIEKIVKYTINDCHGVLCLTNSKGQATHVINLISDNDNFLIDVTKKEEDVLIKLHIIIKFGVSIKQLTTKMIHEIKTNVYDVTGIMPKTVYVYIKGIKSKKMAKRNILIKG